MFTHKHMRMIAIFVLIIFVITIFVFPRIFTSNRANPPPPSVAPELSH